MMGSRALGVVGVVLVLLGVVWILQGTNVLPGTFMSGQTMYAILGGAALLVGALLAWRSFMRT